MRQILLTRHGQTNWNAIGRLQGHTDITLDDTGRDQARALAATLATANLTAVYTSDLARARETGAIIATTLALPAPEIDAELRERAFGIFEGLTRDECATRHPEAWRAWVEHSGEPPGGEPRDEAVARMERVLARIAAAGDRPALVVSHGGVMRHYLVTLLGGRNVPLIPNGATYVLDHDGRRFRARLQNSPS